MFVSLLKMHAPEKWLEDCVCLIFIQERTHKYRQLLWLITTNFDLCKGVNLQGKVFALSFCYWSELQGLTVPTVPLPCETGPFPGTAGTPSATPLQTQSLQYRYMEVHTLATLLSYLRSAKIMMQALINT